MTWRHVVGFEGLYRVSDDGHVESLPRVIPHARTGQRTLPGRMLKTETMKSGHLRVTLHKDNTKTKRYVHRLILEAFVGPRPDGMEACHSNGDPTDNRVANLRWDTRAANHADAIRHGTAYRNTKLTPQAVSAIRAAIALGCSVSAVARAAMCSRANVRRIRDGVTWPGVPALANITDPDEARAAIWREVCDA